MKLLSIIIPVYKVEKYVGATLQSIVDQRQDLFDYEVIVVDDGTPDKSMDIVESYSSRMPQMLILHQENKGLSGARNTGLRHATGKYVWFVDSDDMLSRDAFETLLPVLQKNDAEIYTFGMFGVHEGKNDIFRMRTLYAKKPAKYDRHCFKGIELRGVVGMGVAQKNIFTCSFLKEHDLWFVEGIYHEDLEFLVRAYFFAQQVYVSDNAIYIYLLRHSGSIMATRNEKHLASQLTIMKSYRQFGNIYAKTPEEKGFVNSYILGMALKVFMLDDSCVKGYTNYMKINGNTIREMGIKAGVASFNTISVKSKAKLCLLILCPNILRLIGHKADR